MQRGSRTRLGAVGWMPWLVWSPGWHLVPSACSQTLKTLKCKQELNKKKEMSRLLSKLDAQAGLGPPVGRLSELWREPPHNPEETIT